MKQKLVKFLLRDFAYNWVMDFLPDRKHFTKFKQELSLVLAIRVVKNVSKRIPRYQIGQQSGNCMIMYQSARKIVNDLAGNNNAWLFFSEQYFGMTYSA